MGLRSCAVSYHDMMGITHSVDVSAETLYEAVILGLKAMNFKGGMHHITIDVRAKKPETTHSITGAVLEAWLARDGKNPAEQALKQKLEKIRRG
jgi:hypothetical protein